MSLEKVQRFLRVEVSEVMKMPRKDIITEKVLLFFADERNENVHYEVILSAVKDFWGNLSLLKERVHEIVNEVKA